MPLREGTAVDLIIFTEYRAVLSTENTAKSSVFACPKLAAIYSVHRMLR